MMMRGDMFEHLQGTRSRSKHYMFAISCVSQSLEQIHERGSIIVLIFQPRNLRHREIKYLVQTVQLGKGKT